VLTQTFATSIKSAAGGTVVSESTAFTADAEHDINNQVAAASTVIESVAVDVSQIEAFYMYSDQEVVVTPYEGVSATVDGPFTIPAKKAIWWNTGRTEDNPFTADFSSLHIHNAGDAAANVKCGFLVHEAS
jgi:putative methionine-R-sulfoxide reductase with GAF domain